MNPNLEVTPHKAVRDMVLLTKTSQASAVWDTKGGEELSLVSVEK